MNRTRLALAILSLLTLGACASTEAPTSVAQQRVQSTDYARVSAVNLAAQRTGVQEVWIHYPTHVTEVGAGGQAPADTAS
jgi:hypothetical protein